MATTRTRTRTLALLLMLTPLACMKPNPFALAETDVGTDVGTEAGGGADETSDEAGSSGRDPEPEPADPEAGDEGPDPDDGDPGDGDPTPDPSPSDDSGDGDPDPDPTGDSGGSGESGDDDDEPVPLDLGPDPSECGEPFGLAPACDACLAEACCAELSACADDPDCLCFAACALAGGSPNSCKAECDAKLSDAPDFEPLYDCADDACDGPC